VALIQGNAHKSSVTGFYPYQIDGSLRFNDNDSAYLNRTFAPAGNRQTWTWSVWVKRGNLGTTQHLFQSFGAGGFGIQGFIRFSTADTLDFWFDYNGGSPWRLITNQVFRDTSAWYHIVVVADTSNATSSDRLRLYVNGARVTSFGTFNYPSLNANGTLNQNYAHNIGQLNSADYFDGYMAEVHFINGQSDTASITSGSAVVTGLSDTSTLQIGLSVSGTGIASGTVITSIDSSTQITISENATATNASATLAFTPLQDAFGELKSGIWVAKSPSVTYGTNGFYLDFANSADIGNDVSGEGNDWTPNNFTASDVVLDSPTNNFCTLNSLDKSASLPSPSNGNLDLTNAASAWFAIRSTIGVTSGKWYAEITQTGSNSFAGVMSQSSALNFASYLGSTGIYGFFNNGGTGYPYANGTSGSSFTVSDGDVIGLAYDYDAQTVAIYKNGALQGTVSSVPNTEPMFFCAAFAQTSATHSWNFGQLGFTYTPPTDYLALSTANLPEPAISPADDESPSDYFVTNLWPGNSGTYSITGNNFAPDLVWIKCRNTAHHHYLVDTIRGSSNMLATNLTNTEPAFSPNEFTSFNSDGYTVNFAATGGRTNYAPDGPYVGWSWKAGGTGVSNTAGSRTSTVSVNQDAGFSIVSWTANAVDPSTVGHGLGVAPDVIIIKARTGVTDQWRYGGSNLPSWSYSLALSSTSAQTIGPDVFNQTAPTSTVFTVGGDASVNTNNATMIAYCFAGVEGYSSFGSYTGNASTDGPFVYTGFRPAWVLVKRTDAANNWILWDTTRNTYNQIDDNLYPDSAAAENNDPGIDALSNGFKIRGTALFSNASGGTYIYMAFAENPFKYANAR